MAKITLRENEPIDEAIQRFKNACRREGFYDHINDKRYFTKPSMRKHMLERKRKSGGSKVC